MILKVEKKQPPRCSIFTSVPYTQAKNVGIFEIKPSANLYISKNNPPKDDALENKKYTTQL
jgi:hypothetical protein